MLIRHEVIANTKIVKYNMEFYRKIINIILQKYEIFIKNNTLNNQA